MSVAPGRPGQARPERNGGTGAATDAAAQAARHAYGRLVSHLAWQWRDLAAAEDALGDALLAALQRWPADGVPDSPEGWLLAVARRELLQSARHARLVERLADDPLVRALCPREDDAAPEPLLQAQPVPDQRLRLMLVCAHPAIDPAVRTPLMLQAVLGLDARRIASAFLVSPAAMAQRLVRAKQKIAQAGIAFEEPDAVAPERVHAVLEAIYAAYGLAWERWGAPTDEGAASAELAAEALFLAELCTGLMPRDAEALGLWSLMLFCESRRHARFVPGPDGAPRFVPLHEQDTARWDTGQLRQADALLRQAAALGELGPYQLEAAIQSAHAQRAVTGRVPWAGIVRLYEALLAISPTRGAEVGHAVALGAARGPAAGLAQLEAMPPAQRQTYAPWWVARCHLLEAARDWVAAAGACEQAMGLSEDPRLRDHLWRKLQALRAAPG